DAGGPAAPAAAAALHPVPVAPRVRHPVPAPSRAGVPGGMVQAVVAGTRTGSFAMPDITLHDVPSEEIDALEARGQRHGRTGAEELRHMLHEAASEELIVEQL